MKKRDIPIYSILVRMIGGLRAWNQRRRAKRALRALTDYLLRDIGIERHEIMGDAVQHDPVYPRSQHQPGSVKTETLLIPPKIKDAA